MKKVKLRLVAIITVIALLLTACGIGSFVFADNIPEPVILNNGSGTGNHSFGGIDGSFYKKGTVNNDSADGKALSLTAVADMTQANVFSLKVAESVNNFEDVKAISLYVELPDANKTGYTNAYFSFYLNAQQNGLKGKRYAISNDGNIIEDFKKLSNFKGTILIILPDDDEFTFTPTWGSTKGNYTWKQFIKKYGFKNFGFYLDYDNSIKGQTMVFDELTVYYDADQALSKCKLSINPPKADIAGGIVQKGTEITLTGEEGTDIYYTLDGSQPTIASTKYTPENKPVINENCTLKAVAFKDGAESLTITCNYTMYDTTLPNVTILNDLEDPNTVNNSVWEGKATARESVEAISPYGKALSVTGINPANSGSNLIYKNMSDMDTSLLAAQEAVAFWISVPEGQGVGIGPCINDQKYQFMGKVATYNTSTQILEEYNNSSAVKLDGFEGFVILKTKGDSVRTSWSNSDVTSWRSFITNNGLKNFTFYMNTQAYYNKTFYIDHFVAIADLEKFIEELNKEPKRPMSPTADPGSDAVPMDTQVFLYAGDSCSIYYTTDGTAPVVENGVCTNGKLYETYSMGNGQEDASYIELKKETTVKAVAVNTDNVVSGMSTFKYTIEPPYDGPNVVVVNDGTGEGNNIWGWLSDEVFEKSIVDNDSPDGKGMALKTLTNKRIVQELHFKVDTEGVEQIHNITGYSFHVDVPDLGDDSYKMYFGLRASGNSNYVKAKIYAISDDGETVLKAENGINLSEFKGTVYCVLTEPNAVSMKYGAVDKTWYKFIKENSLTQFGFYFTRNEIPETSEYQHTFVIDDFSLIYNTEKLFEDIGLDGLLATYDAGTFENTNMIVTNDCSGEKKNAGLSDFSENLVIEKTDYSLDERSLKLTIPEGESFIQFVATSKVEELVIGDGTVFWVEMPKGAGQTEIGLELIDASTDGTELYEYGNKWFYLIDKNGVIYKKTGNLILPDGFRGWIVVPKENMFIAERDGYSIANAELDYNQVSDVKVIFRNKQGELTGKAVHIDDISFYTSFSDLVVSRALKWEGQVFE